MPRKLNILFMGPNFTDLVCISCYTSLERAVAKIANCRWAGEGYRLHRPKERLKDTVQRVMPDADWVLYHSFEILSKKKNIRVPQERSFKLGIHTGDIHRAVNRRIKYINRHGWDVFLTSYVKLGSHVVPETGRPTGIDPEHYLKNIKIPILQVAPWIDPEVYKPTGKPRNIDVTFLGAIENPWYPLRAKIWRQLPTIAEKEHWRIIRRRSPRGRSMERRVSELRAEHFVGDKYADVLARSKIFIFDTSIFKYPLLKFPESMACGACAMSDIPLGAEEYHLVPDENFVAINERNWRNKLKYYVEHDDEREEIARRGYETIMKYHTIDIRAKQIVEFLEEFDS